MIQIIGTCLINIMLFAISIGLLLIGTAFFIDACRNVQEYRDQNKRDRITELTNRVAELEKTCSEMEVFFKSIKVEALLKWLLGNERGPI